MGVSRVPVAPVDILGSCRLLLWVQVQLVIVCFFQPRYATSLETVLFDRFRVICPADVSCIRQFEPSLIHSSSEENNNNNNSEASSPLVVWAAVYRSNNNNPSVFGTGDFLQSPMMTRTTATPEDDPALKRAFVSPMIAESPPVAVARLRAVAPANINNNCSSADDKSDMTTPTTPATATTTPFIMDSMRCILVKETTDVSCDGGSEHTEALATAIDALLHHYLVHIMENNNKNNEHDLIAAASSTGNTFGFEGSIGTKATLVSAPLLEDRGFRPVTKLTQDMLTHTSSLDDCLERFAARAVAIQSPAGPRKRAMDIVSRLGRIARSDDLERARLRRLEQETPTDSDEEEKPYNPWASRYF